MTIRNIALDPGFGGFKAAEIQGDAVKVVTVPSVVGTGSTDLGLLDLAGVTGRRRRAEVGSAPWKRATTGGWTTLTTPTSCPIIIPVGGHYCV